MTAYESGEETPRWGAQNRKIKAEAIWQTLVRAGDDPRRHGRWLDVGCGSGGIVAALADRVQEIHGIDPEPWPGWKRMASAHPNLTFSTGAFDQTELPLPHASVDMVICNQVYEHVTDPEQLVRNIHAVLRPGGRCYFAGPNLLWPIEPHVFWPFVHWLPRTLAQRLMRLLGSRQASQLDAFSAHYWTHLRRFRESGFAVRCAVDLRLKVALAASPMPLLSSLVPGPLIRVFEPFSPAFVFLLEKPCSAIDGR